MPERSRLSRIINRVVEVFLFGIRHRNLLRASFVKNRPLVRSGIPPFRDNAFDAEATQALGSEDMSSSGAGFNPLYVCCLS